MRSGLTAAARMRLIRLEYPVYSAYKTDKTTDMVRVT